MKKLVLLGFLLIAINATLIQTISLNSDGTKNIIRVAALLLMFIYAFLVKRKMSVYLLFALTVSFVLLIVSKNPDQLSYIFIFIIVQCFIGMRERDVEKYLLISSAIGFSLVFMFLNFELTENITTTWGGRSRMNYGTAGVPFFYNLVYGTFVLLIMYAKKYYTSYKNIFILLSIISAYYFYTTTDIRGGFYSFLLFIVMLYVIPLTKRFSIVKYMVAFSPVFYIGGSLIIASFYKRPELNLLLSYRPMFLNNFYSKLAMSDLLISKSVKAFDFNGIVDNSYVHLLVGGSLLVTIVVLIIFWKAILNLYEDNKYNEIAFVISICAYFNSESLIVRAENMFVIYFWYLIIKYAFKKVKVEKFKTLPIEQKKKKIEIIKFKKHKLVW